MSTVLTVIIALLLAFGVVLGVQQQKSKNAKK